MRNYVNYLSYFLLVLVIGILTFHNYRLNKKINDEIIMLQKTNEESKVHTTIYYDQIIESLKKSNNELYDSIKIFKNKIDYLVEFNYKKDYEISRLIRKNKENDTIRSSKTYEYFSEKNDTLKYSLKINSAEEPNWYKLNLTVADKFTLINKKIDNSNQLDINTNNKADVSKVTVVKTKEKRNILSRFALGPSISLGYDLAKKEPEFMVGISLTFDMLGK